jgi:hypothetical protein
MVTEALTMLIGVKRPVFVEQEEVMAVLLFQLPVNQPKWSSRSSVVL